MHIQKLLVALAAAGIVSAAPLAHEESHSPRNNNHGGYGVGQNNGNAAFDALLAQLEQYRGSHSGLSEEVICEIRELEKEYPNQAQYIYAKLLAEVQAYEKSHGGRPPWWYPFLTSAFPQPATKTTTKHTTTTAGPTGTPTIVNGRQCTTYKGYNRPDGTYATKYTNSFKKCIATCAADLRCVSAQYHEDNGYCYLKNVKYALVKCPNVDNVDCGGIAASTRTTTTTKSSSTKTSCTSTSSAIRTSTGAPTSTSRAGSSSTSSSSSSQISSFSTGIDASSTSTSSSTSVRVTSTVPISSSTTNSQSSSSTSTQIIPTSEGPGPVSISTSSTTSLPPISSTTTTLVATTSSIVSSSVSTVISTSISTTTTVPTTSIVLPSSTSQTTSTIVSTTTTSVPTTTVILPSSTSQITSTTTSTTSTVPIPTTTSSTTTTVVPTTSSAPTTTLITTTTTAAPSTTAVATGPVFTSINQANCETATPTGTPNFNVIPTSCGFSWLDNVNMWRKAYNLHEFTWDSRLASVGYGAGYNASGGAKPFVHSDLAYWDSFGEIESPGWVVPPPGVTLHGFTGFGAAIANWLCEVPSDPQLMASGFTGIDVCSTIVAGIDFISENPGETAHHDILLGNYNTIGCGFAADTDGPQGQGRFAGLYVCDFGY